MKAAEIEKLKDMSSDVIECLPTAITTNGKNDLFCHGKLMDLMTLLRDIENVRDKMTKLNATIQFMKVRKSSNK